ncbi:ATP-binding protein [Streptomyces zagrosensis]|uniref:Anti-sigma regulatory factor (Ser/Thr protein kinase) n=1 Tax=Streptomyces zagrosensis TaxID=1042984 RepID=A0A7W9Q9I3_9ACTN|nr:ATP-binding protein [Streptomyces zagrosensis]MBB5936128.1 anti-sigma regulatory factor (Ser/Thr protein kinase) [Streptomyces zagrosensis]
MTRQLRRGELSGISDVRRGLRELLRQWGDGQDRAQIAELLISELATNALVHTESSAIVTARLTSGPRAHARGRLRVEVRDFGARSPKPRTDAEQASTSGRGLLLVEDMADVWGVREHGVGKAVWFELGASGSG